MIVERDSLSGNGVGEWLLLMRRLVTFYGSSASLAAAGNKNDKLHSRRESPNPFVKKKQ